MHEKQLPDPAIVQLLHTLAQTKDLSHGIRLHCHLVERGLPQTSPYIASALIHMYAKCGVLAKAQQVLDRLPARALVVWNALIAGYARQGNSHEAFECFAKMQSEGRSPDEITFTCMLKACAATGNVDMGKQIHEDIVKRGLLSKRNIVLGNALLGMYAKCGMLVKAQQFLAELPVRDVASWNTMLTAYAQHNKGHDALDCFLKMQTEGLAPDEITFISLLKSCSSIGALDKCKWIHDEIIHRRLLKKNALLGTALVDAYAKCGALTRAQRVLEGLPSRDTVTWSALISGYSHQERGHDALRCYAQMKKEGISPNEVTFICILKACASIGDIDKGEEIHKEIVQRGLLKKNIILGTSLVDLYAKCGMLSKAHQVHGDLPVRNSVSWNALIAGHTLHRQGHEALNCFVQMQKEGFSADGVTCTCILKACAINKALREGKAIHEGIVNRGLLENSSEIGNGLVDMYAKCGMLADAQKMLERLPVRDVVSWNAMIAGYIQNSRSQEGLKCFSQMQREGFSPDQITFASILTACGSIGAISEGENIHDEISNRRLLGNNMILSNALVNMYAKCGILAKARQVLEELPVRDTRSWSAVIAGYAQDGHCSEALYCFEQMEREGIHPNEITFLSVLNACSHSGNVYEAERYYRNMAIKYGMTPKLEHNTCMVVTFGFIGRFDKAMTLIKSTSSSNDSSIWLALLGACSKWSNVALARLVFDIITQLDDNLAAAYVLMAKTYAAAGLHEDAKTMEDMRNKRSNPQRAFHNGR